MMTEVIHLKCRPYTRFHLGDFTEDQRSALNDTSTVIHSDVLYSAFLSMLNLKYPDKTEDFIQHFRDGTLRLSSAFYCIERVMDKNEMVYLLPKPLSLDLKATYKQAKFIKKVEFISLGVWEKGILPDQWNDDELCIMSSGQFVALKEELPQISSDFLLFKKTDDPKVRVRTDEAEGNFYYQSDIMLMGNEAHRVHWYFLLDNDLENDDKRIWEEILNILSMNGLGGQRSTGSGQIREMGKKVFEEPDIPEAAYYASLSLTIPDSDEMESFDLYKSLVRGGRFTGSGERLKAVQMLKEGAIQSKKGNGTDVIIGKNHLRCGFNYLLPLHPAFNP